MPGYNAALESTEEEPTTEEEDSFWGAYLVDDVCRLKGSTMHLRFFCGALCCLVIVLFVALVAGGYWYGERIRRAEQQQFDMETEIRSLSASLGGLEAQTDNLRSRKTAMKSQIDYVIAETAKLKIELASKRRSEADHKNRLDTAAKVLAWKQQQSGYVQPGYGATPPPATVTPRRALLGPSGVTAFYAQRAEEDRIRFQVAFDHGMSAEERVVVIKQLQQLIEDLDAPEPPPLEDDDSGEDLGV